MNNIKNYDNFEKVNELKRLYGGDNLEQIDGGAHGDVGRGMIAPETGPSPGMAPYSHYSKETLAKMLFSLEKRVKYLESEVTRLWNYSDHAR